MPRRRSRGEGTFSRLPSGGYRLQFSLGVVNGVRQRASVTGRTMAECRERQQAYLQAEHPAPLSGSPRQTLAPYLEQWLVARSPYLRPTTQTLYSWAVKQHLIPSLGAVKLRSLTRQDVEAAMVGMRLSPRSTNMVRTILRAALKDAQRDYLVSTNAAELARPLPQPKSELHHLSADETETLLSHLQGSRLYGPVLLAARYGMRQGEVLGLSFSDVSSTALTVRHTLHYVTGGTFSLDEPKTRASGRVLPLTEEVRQVIQVEADRQAFERRAPVWLSQYDPWGLVFREPNGLPLRGQWVRRRFQSALRDLGLPVVHFHDLRHGAASRMLDAGVDYKVIQELLGHAYSSTTLDFYLHPAMDALLGALNSIGKRMAHEG